MLEVNIRLRRGTFQLDAAFNLRKPGVIALFQPNEHYQEETANT